MISGFIVTTSQSVSVSHPDFAFLSIQASDYSLEHEPLNRASQSLSLRVYAV